MNIAAQRCADLANTESALMGLTDQHSPETFILAPRPGYIAFRKFVQHVNDVVKSGDIADLQQFVLPDPVDLLVEAVEAVGNARTSRRCAKDVADLLRAELAARGLEIVSK